MSNRLAGENSSYLLQHADNPVDWYPWGEEALKTARDQDKPIFLSIGYAACHWCHVMAHESFEDPEIATIMNKNFINVKVDREERPDLDSLYMNAVVAMTGSGGWPMSVFLTPQGQPFYGGTYFPPVRRYNIPAFREVLETVVRLWKDDRSRILRSGEEITHHLLESQDISHSAKPLNAATLQEAAMRLAQSYDWKNGGWGRAPKFPQPMVIEFLLRLAVHGDRLASDIATHTLDAMSKGGMYDVIGGGFARYSTDDLWLVPHFEKMLYDNAQLARVYLHAYLVTGRERYRRVCEETLDFVKRELMDEETGGMYSSLDADSDGEEGKFYVWNLVEITEILTQAMRANGEAPSPDWAEFFCTAYNVTREGNFEGSNVLQRAVDDQVLAQRYNLQVSQVHLLIRKLHACLLFAREKRVRPVTDDKVLTAWNALGLVAFAEAARHLERSDYLEVARRNANFILTELHPADRLLRAWRAGKAQHNAYLEDYAGLVVALLALYQTDHDPRWFNSALGLANDMLEHFRDPNFGFFDTRDDHESLVLRPKDIQDNATPSGNALAAVSLLELAAFTSKGDWHGMVEVALGIVSGLVCEMPVFFGKWLCAIDFTLTPTQEIAILGELDHPKTRSMLKLLWSQYRPHSVLAVSQFPPAPTTPPLLHNRPLLDNLPTAYICRNFVCQRPVNSIQEFKSLLES